MNDIITERMVFLTLVASPGDKTGARLLIDSIRSFGGKMSGCPVWVFEADPRKAPCADLSGPGVEVIPLDTPAPIRQVLFGHKVYACARAEELAMKGYQTLTWIDPNCLVVQEPRLFDLDEACDAAVRPVHIRNVGLPADGPLDDFWKGIYAALGVDDISATVTSFVDGQQLRAYFNSHAFAINPARGLMCRWLEVFEGLTADWDFQTLACQDELHQIFLFQAILSTLLASSIAPERLRILPPTYNYPYHLHGRVPGNALLRIRGEGWSLISPRPRQGERMQVRGLLPG